MTEQVANTRFFDKWFLLEAAAVLSGAAYTVLITYGSTWCWPMGIVSSCIFTYLLLNKKLLAETLLQLFYVGFGIYGWLTWGSDSSFQVTSLGWYTNALILAAGGLAVGVSGFLLGRFTQAKLPYIDSFTTVFSLIATWMMVHAIFENWIYWVIIDAISIFMYADRGLYLASVLFAAYTFLALNGLYEWLELL